MLVLSRNVSEEIVLTLPDSRRITITFVDLRNRRTARLGISAPTDVIIHRGEVQAAVDAGIENPNIAAKAARLAAAK